MASNFWTSSHRIALLTEEEAELLPPEVIHAGFSPADASQFTSFFCRRIFLMTASLARTRLRVAATACIYFQRFFRRHTWKVHDPRAVAVACIYVAMKTEENNAQVAKVYTALALEHDASLLHATFNTKTLLDTEMLIMQAFDCHLLIFSVHTELGTLLGNMKEHDANLRAAAFEEHLDSDKRPRLSRTAWGVACDAHCSTAVLTEPPAAIALACIILAAKLESIDVSKWLEGMQFDEEAVMRAVTAVVRVQAAHEMSQAEVLRRLRNLGWQVGARTAK